MKLTEIKGNLFDSKDDYFTHCISSDCEMGVGIAVEMNKKFRLKNGLLQFSEEERKHPACILVNGVFNLITKKKYFNKPTYESLKESLRKMRILMIHNQVRDISMPRIGCGLDKLSWPNVRDIIKQVFDGVDCEINVYYL